MHRTSKSFYSNEIPKHFSNKKLKPGIVDFKNKKTVLAIFNNQIFSIIPKIRFKTLMYKTSKKFYSNVICKHFLNKKQKAGIVDFKKKNLFKHSIPIKFFLLFQR